MGGVSVDSGGHGGKKPVDAEISLIPFIDLLLCCVMFLLVTAVWNQLARLNANQQQPSQQAQDEPPPEEKVKLVLQVMNSGFVLASTGGDRLEIPKAGDSYDLEELKAKLEERKRLEPNRTDIIVAAEDGVRYEDVIDAMDMVIGVGFPDVSIRDAAMAAL